jgi:hypothetical protein
MTSNQYGGTVSAINAYPEMTDAEVETVAKTIVDYYAG